MAEQQGLGPSAVELEGNATTHMQPNPDADTKTELSPGPPEDAEKVVPSSLHWR